MCPHHTVMRILRRSCVSFLSPSESQAQMSQELQGFSHSPDPRVLVWMWGGPKHHQKLKAKSYHGKIWRSGGCELDQPATSRASETGKGQLGPS